MTDSDRQLSTAVVAGATGLIGRRIVEHLCGIGWPVIGISRGGDAVGGARMIAVDLADAAATRAALADARTVTHAFYASRHDHPEGVPESVEQNAAMLVNLVGALEANGAPLAHVNVVHGTKYYGHQLGPIPVDVDEDGPRAAVRNFYHAHEDFLRARAGRWTWTIARPHTFCDPRTDHPRSVGLVLAVYATLQQHLGRPLDFPGTERAFHAVTQCTDTRLLARACAWMATEPACANKAFNLINGHWFRWSEVWPDIAAAFGLAPGRPRGHSLAAYMRDKEPDWNAIVRAHGLRHTRLAQIALWDYGDYVFRPEWDIITSMDRARSLGWTERIDTMTMLRAFFLEYRAAGIVP